MSWRTQTHPRDTPLGVHREGTGVGVTVEDLDSVGVFSGTGPTPVVLPQFDPCRVKRPSKTRTTLLFLLTVHRRSVTLHPLEDSRTPSPLRGPGPPDCPGPDSRGDRRPRGKPAGRRRVSQGVLVSDDQSETHLWGPRGRTGSVRSGEPRRSRPRDSRGR